MSSFLSSVRPLPSHVSQRLSYSTTWRPPSRCPYPSHLLAQRDTVQVARTQLHLHRLFVSEVSCAIFSGVVPPRSSSPLGSMTQSSRSLQATLHLQDHVLQVELYFIFKSRLFSRMSHEVLHVPLIGLLAIRDVTVSLSSTVRGPSCPMTPSSSSPSRAVDVDKIGYDGGKRNTEHVLVAFGRTQAVPFHTNAQYERGAFSKTRAAI